MGQARPPLVATHGTMDVRSTMKRRSPGEKEKKAAFGDWQVIPFNGIEIRGVTNGWALNW